MTNYDEIYEYASGRHGIVTSSEAHTLGVSDKELSRLTTSGRLTRLGRGVYRIRHHVPGKVDQYAVAVACSGEDAFLYGESVLALLDLGVTDPRRVHVGVTRRVRRHLPSYVELHKMRIASEVCLFEGIRSQTLVDALISASATMMPERIKDAATEAMRRGMLFTDEYQRILKVL